MKTGISESLRGKRLVVLGGGESGIGAAVLGKKAGMDVFLSDRGALKENYRRQLDSRGIPFEEGKHTLESIMNADIVVKSPGIPDKAPLIKDLHERNIPVVSEIEFAGWFTDARMVCITGSNGKTTTTSLIHHIFREAGVNAGLAGNIGMSLALQVAEDPKPVYVIELSSFQLDGMKDFKADVAVLLNITPDHLDRYDYKLENYAKSKLRITQNQTPDDYFIYWLDDAVIEETMKGMRIEATPLPFSRQDSSGAAAEIRGKEIAFNLKDKAPWKMDCGNFQLQGSHNMLNIAAAALASLAFGLTPKQIEEGARTFSPVEHRLEFIGENHGVKWYNDSKATNVASTFYALESMPGNVILILGGTDKGNDYSEIETLVRRKVKSIVCMGADNSKLMNFFSGKVPSIHDTNSLEQAVEACRKEAVEGDTVLLSPCCASFDLFKNYEDRGRKFKNEVKKHFII